MSSNESDGESPVPYMPHSWKKDVFDIHKLQHTWGDLETMVTEKMIEECKLDACIDHFLKGLAEITSEDPVDHFGCKEWELWDGSLDLSMISEKHDREYSGVLNDLRRNLNRLLPGYIENDGSDLFNNAKLQDRLKSRSRLKTEKAFDNTTGDVPDAFRRNLLTTLVEQRYQGRVPNSQPWLETYRQLRNYIEGQNASASFTCGGSIPIGDSEVSESAAHHRQKSSAPINIFWAVGGQSSATKLVLPLDKGNPESSHSILEQLVKDCNPATFGKGEQDVFDPEYRRAGKMERHDFATSFHPADFGIIENIEQILLPSISTEIQNSLGFRKLTAELYKLNVYSSPSGLFRKHVDTPRSENQIGSLVVCLPSQFEGGIFTVQHDKQKVEFDWSKQSNSAIQWAAFYSDCEHEIQTVTKGQRITLTYNLYVTEPAGAIGLDNSIVESQSLPLYGFLKDLLSEEDFMPEGGVLGVYCSHSYPHNSKVANLQLPRSLKGADLILYSVFRSLGIDIDVLPIIEYGGNYGSRNRELEVKGVVEEEKNFYFLCSDWESDAMVDYLKTGKIPEQIKSFDFLPPGIADSMDIDQYWKLLLMSRRVEKIRETAEFVNKEGLATDGVYSEEGARVGTARKEYAITDRGYDEEPDSVGQIVWPTYYLPGIVWINEPRHEERAFSQIVYGNEAGVGTRYSCAAILAVIPPLKDRKQTIEQL